MSSTLKQIRCMFCVGPNCRPQSVTFRVICQNTNCFNESTLSMCDACGLDDVLYVLE